MQRAQSSLSLRPICKQSHVSSTLSSVLAGNLEGSTAPGFMETHWPGVRLARWQGNDKTMIRTLKLPRFDNSTPFCCLMVFEINSESFSHSSLMEAALILFCLAAHVMQSGGVHRQRYIDAV